MANEKYVMMSDNPTGAGSFSLNRKSGTTVGDCSHAEGSNTTAEGVCSHAEGSGTSALGNYSHAEGLSASDYELGKATISAINNNILTISDFTNWEDMEDNYCKVVKDQYSMIITFSSQSDNTITLFKNVDGFNVGDIVSIRIGGLNFALGQSSHSEGIDIVALGEASHAEGGSTIASGFCSHAEGLSAKAAGECSHAEGLSAKALGNYSHAEGSRTRALGNYSHAEGGSTTVSGDFSHAEGGITTASGSYSHAEGCSTTASGNFSHAEGSSTTASGKYSHAGGCGTTASADYSTVIGIGNDPQPDDLFEIGNGSVFDAQGNILPEESRIKSNALRITKDGRVIAKTDVELENGTKLSKIPTKVSELTNDSKYTTETYVTNALNNKVVVASKNTNYLKQARFIIARYASPYGWGVSVPLFPNSNDQIFASVNGAFVAANVAWSKKNGTITESYTISGFNMTLNNITYFF